MPATDDPGMTTPAGAGADVEVDVDDDVDAKVDAKVDVEVDVEVELDGATHRLPWPARTPLLEVLTQAGLAAPASCRQGRCGACTCRVTAGTVRLIENQVLDEHDLQQGYVLACQALPETAFVRVSYD